MSRREHGGILFRLLVLLVLAGILAAIYGGRHPLMRMAAEYWVVDEPVVPSDALIVLGGDNFSGDRSFHAADLYRAGAAPVVVASDRMLRPKVSVADVMAHDLESYGVPAKSIIALSHRAMNTREEAVEVARLVQSRGWKRVLVVTSNYHTRRARFIFERVLSPGVSVRVSAARDSEFDPSHWWETRQGQKLFLSELVGYLVARWELRKRPAAEHAASLRAPAPAFGGEGRTCAGWFARFPPVSDWKQAWFTHPG